MKFDRLNSSIALNAREKPSIYMALCMVESLFRDVEDAAGKELSRTEPGDEQLPTKLIWLGRQLLKIYSENSETLVRNRDRLDKMMEKVREQEHSLSGLAQVSAALSAAEAKYASLASKLDQAESDREETERLEEACRQTQERLARLEGTDPSRARAELEQLSARERQLSAQRSELTKTLEERREAVTALENACGNLQRDGARAQDRLQELSSRQLAAETALAELNSGIADREKQLAACTREKDKLIEEQAYLEQQLLEHRQELGDYEQVHMAPLRAEHEANLRKQEEMGTEFTVLRQKRDDAVLQVARLAAQIAAARQDLEEKKKDLQQKQQTADQAAAETARLQAQADAETDRLAALQREAAELEGARLPQLQNLLAEQHQQNKQLEDSIGGLEQRKEKLQLEIDRLKQEDESLSAEVAQLKQEHDALIASSEANSEAVKKLRRNVEELQGRNDREKEKRYLQQLEEERDKLEELSRNCEALEQQTAAAQTSLERKQLQVAELRKKKEDLENSLRQISILTQELAPQGDAALQRRVTALQSRQRLLEDTHKNLEESVEMMQSMLGIPPESLTTNPEGLSESLQMCGRALDKLQKALVKCANSIKTEIKMDTIMEEE